MAQKRIPVEETFSWQRPIISISNEGTATKGNRYIVGSSPTGIFAALTTNNIAWYDGSAWQEDTPQEGWVVYDRDQNKELTFNGSSWVESPSGSGDMLKSTYDTDNDGIVDKAETIDDGAGNSASAADVKDAVTKKHAQNTDTYLDFGGANQISAAQAKEAYDRRGSYDSDLGCILMDL